VTPDAGAQPGEQGPADRSSPHDLLRYRSAQGRWVVAAMILGSSVAGIDSTVIAIALPAIGRNLHTGFAGLQWTVTSYTLTLASLILLAGRFAAGRLHQPHRAQGGVGRGGRVRGRGSADLGP
jgi:MFS family permease